jgi:PAS domain S-box-containing protein
VVLKRTAEQFRLLFEAAPNGVMAVAATGAIILLNRQIETMFGYARDDLIGQPVDILVPKRLRDRHVDLRRQMAVAPQPRPMGMQRDLFGVRKDGSEFPVEVGLNPIAADVGGGFVVTVVDISDRKRIEARDLPREHERTLVEILQRLGMPAAVLHTDGHVLYANPLLTTLRCQFVLKGSRIELAHAAENDQFVRALAAMDGETDSPSGRTIPVAATDEHPPLAYSLVRMTGITGGTLAVLVVTAIGALGVPPTELVERLFALAPAEARVAALIASGASPRQAAIELGLSEGTVRTTLKHVFAKTGVSRQSTLAALLARFSRQ